MLCVLIAYRSCRTYSLKSTPNDIFFEKLLMAVLIYSQIFTRNLLRGNRRRNTFCIFFRCLAWVSNLGFTSNKPTHDLLDYGDFKNPIDVTVTKILTQNGCSNESTENRSWNAVEDMFSTPETCCNVIMNSQFVI